MPSSEQTDEVLEEVECPSCPGAGKIPLYDLNSNGKRSIVRCADCSLIYVTPRIARDRIASTYSGQDYFERKDDRTGYSNYLEDRDLHLLFFRRQLTELEEKFPNRGRLLDVGCAGGFLIEAAIENGWQAEGVELSQFASAYARDTLGLQVRTGSLVDAKFESNSFEVVVMDDVIEHLENPLTEALEVWRILKPGGTFLLHTPNAASPWRHLMGRKWIHLKPDEHLYYFEPATIKHLLNQAGFDVLYAKACSKATNATYILGVLEKKLPWIAWWANALFPKHPLWSKAFPFRGGGMQIYAVKRPSQISP